MRSLTIQRRRRVITKMQAFLTTSALGVAVVTGAIAQPAPSAPAQFATKPEQTTASFGDWTLRCNLRLDITPPQRFCELALVIQKPGEAGTQGQLAVGRLTLGEPLRLTAVLPSNIAFKARPKLVLDGKDPISVELTWTRCLTGACFSDAPITDELLSKLRARSEPGRIDYRDGTDRETSLPVSFRGFTPALEALARENNQP